MDEKVCSDLNNLEGVAGLVLWTSWVSPNDVVGIWSGLTWIQFRFMSAYSRIDTRHTIMRHDERTILKYYGYCRYFYPPPAHLPLFPKHQKIVHLLIIWMSNFDEAILNRERHDS